MQFEVIMPNEANRQHIQLEVLAAVADTLKTWHEKMAHQNFRHVKQTISVGGSRYFLLLKDDFSHFRTIYFIAKKAEVKRCIEDFLRKVEKHCPRGVQTLRTDNGLEFINWHIENLIHQFGIRHQRTIAHSPEQNGSVERENRMIGEAARTIIHAKGFELRFWAEAANTAVHVLNCTGTSSVKGLTPYELWHGRKPDIRHLKIFGEEVYSHIPKAKRQKLNPKGQRGIFVGYEENVKGYRIWYEYFAIAQLYELHRYNDFS
ncbi:retrovirus-related pol polyprotein from transposon tnt 1-94 [Lasius niger]|uniref:Retrovirus-related pol polyprotein from transposon tnt 1-94 n=1 Tax=Lasius niger TaxID=67767 RepID=A0A0J7K938_LASNI|nr:retrovirus-related pol polyprotein from transposon tnt 1-94 [Lasius niger]